MGAKLILAALFLLAFPAKVFAAFSIENIDPTVITSVDQEIKLFVTASNLTNSTQYFQVAITKEGSSNYFGLTQNNSGGWHVYDSTPDNMSDLLNFTPVDGAWNGEVNAKLDPNDSGFTGPGVYQVKLLKHISSSGSSSNSMPITVNISQGTQVPTAQPVTQTTETKETKPTQQINFSVPTGLSVGQEFEISFTTSNFEPGTYFIKARIGKDSSHLNSGQTFNNEWLTDTDAWSKFPQTSGSSKIKVRVSPNSLSGDYKIKLSLKKGDETPIQSEEQSISFKENPNPIAATSSKTSVSKTPTPTIVKTSSTKTSTGIVLAAATSKDSIVEAQIAEHYKNVDLLATISAAPKKPGKIRKAINLLLSKKTEDGFPIGAVIAIFGVTLILGSLTFIFRKKIFKLPQDE